MRTWWYRHVLVELEFEPQTGVPIGASSTNPRIISRTMHDDEWLDYFRFSFFPAD